MTTEKVPVAAVVHIKAGKTGSVTARVHVLAPEGFDQNRLKNYAYMAWSALEAHGFTSRDFEIRSAVWHPDRKEYLFDTVFTWTENADPKKKEPAWVMVVSITTTYKLTERLPLLVKALVMPMRHPSVAFTPSAKTNIESMVNSMRKSTRA